MAAKREGIRQRGNSFLVDVTINGKRRTATCSSYEEAQIKRLEIEAEMRGSALYQKQEAAAATSWTLRQALTKTKEVRWDGTRNGDKAASTVEQALKFFGETRTLDGITTNDIDDWVKELRTKEKNSPSTINRKLAYFSALFTDAADRDGCSKRPRIIRLPEPTHRIRYLSPDEELTALSLLSQWQQQSCVDAVITLLDTGMRVGELLKLEVRDIDLDANIISIWQNKGDLPRSVPMTDRVRQLVETRCQRSRGLVFFDLNREQLRYYWDRLRSAMDLDDDDQFVPHALRHTCATRLVQRGVSLYVVKEILGHSSITVTEKYAHLAKDNLRHAINVLQGTVVPDQQLVAGSRNIVAAVGASKELASSVSP